MSKIYANAEAFRNALEDRLRTVAQERGVQIQGLRLKVAIERLLARLFAEKDPPWLLKGGYAMELRFRPTPAISSSSKSSKPAANFKAHPMAGDRSP